MARIWEVSVDVMAEVRGGHVRLPLLTAMISYPRGCLFAALLALDNGGPVVSFSAIVRKLAIVVPEISPPHPDGLLETIINYYIHCMNRLYRSLQYRCITKTAFKDGRSMVTCTNVIMSQLPYPACNLVQHEVRDYPTCIELQSLEDRTKFS